jgi:HPt (histidine-containing phosphotransfer) domain-containing protein
MNFRELALNTGLEEDEFLKLSELFIEVSSSDLKKLQRAIDIGDSQGAAEAAHSIKGASGNLGFEEIYKVAMGIELNARQNILEGATEAVKSLQEKLDQISKDLRRNCHVE